jgi:hypothetical protein
MKAEEKLIEKLPPILEAVVLKAKHDAEVARDNEEVAIQEVRGLKKEIRRLREILARTGEHAHKIWKECNDYQSEAKE